MDGHLLTGRVAEPPKMHNLGLNIARNPLL